MKWLRRLTIISSSFSNFFFFFCLLFLSLSVSLSLSGSGSLFLYVVFLFPFSFLFFCSLLWGWRRWLEKGRRCFCCNQQQFLVFNFWLFGYSRLINSDKHIWVIIFSGNWFIILNQITNEDWLRNGCWLQSRFRLMKFQSLNGRPTFNANVVTLAILIQLNVI